MQVLRGVTVVTLEHAIAAPFATRDRWRKVATPVGQVAALLPPGASAADAPRMDPFMGGWRTLAARCPVTVPQWLGTGWPLCPAPS